MSDSFHDQAVLIGARKTLVGVVTQPANDRPDDRPVFVIINTGIIHRVGHHRMYVRLARELAETGYQVLRFDLSGIGDSESRDDGLPPLESALADIREAIDWLASARRARKVILVGLCSGANQALIYGNSDPRVCGLVLLDPSIPPTRKYFLRHYAHALTAPDTWVKFLVGRGRFWKTARKTVGLAEVDVWERNRVKLDAPAVRMFLQNAYERSMNVGLACLAVFTSGVPHQHNYRRQLLDAFPRLAANERLQLEYFAGCDHVFSSEADRRRLFAMLIRWAEAVVISQRAAAPGPEACQPDDGPSSGRLTYEV